MATTSKPFETTDPLKSIHEESETEISREADKCLLYYKMDSWNERISRLFETRDFADVTFILSPNGEDQHHYIPAHRLILGKKSPTFYEMFYGANPDDRDFIEISGVDPEDFQLMLRHIYGKDVQTGSICQRRKIAELSEKYKLSNLQKQCEDEINNYVNASNALCTFQESMMTQDPDLIMLSLLFIVNETDSILEEGSWTKQGNILPNTITFILRLGERVHLNIKSEVKLIETLIEWAKTRLTINKESVEPVNIRKELEQFLYYIRFFSLSLETIKGISNEILSKENVEGILNFATSPNSFQIPWWCNYTNYRYLQSPKYYSLSDLPWLAFKDCSMCPSPFSDESPLRISKLCKKFKAKTDLFITRLYVSSCSRCSGQSAKITKGELLVKIEKEIKVRFTSVSSEMKLDPPLYVKDGEMLQLMFRLEDTSEFLYACRNWYYYKGDYLCSVTQSMDEDSQAEIKPWCFFHRIDYFPVKI